MKTSRIIFMLALAAAATACNKAELEGTDPAGLKSNQFLASLEGASTKVTMADDFSLSWVAGDQVSVFGEDLKNNLFTADAAGEEVTLNGGEVTVVPEATYYAIYPYSEKNSIADGIITTEIPTVQTPKQGDIPVNFAVARNDGQTFTFYNVCGLVGFNITTNNIKSVTVKSNDSSDYLTGLISVSQEEVGNPTYAVAGGQSYVTLEAETTFSTGYHYVAVLPQTFEKGITVVMTDSEGKVAQKTTTNQFTLNRSHRIDIKNIDASQTWGEKLTSISTVAELQRFLAVADKYAEDETVTLTDDIDVKDCNLVPAASFAGIFNGADKSITNWNTSTALFEKLTGTVKNLVIGESCNLVVQANGDAAFIALENAGTISNCTNNGIVTSVEDVFVPDVKAKYNDRAIGTIAAVSTGSIVYCVNNGTVTITPESVGKYALQFIGGIAGKASASADVNAMESCTNNGAVTFDGKFSSKLFIGGVCGGTPAGAGTFDDYGVFKTLENTAPVTLNVPTPSSVASTYINLGGVIGYAEADLDDCDNGGAVTVTLPKEISESKYAHQRPAIAGVAGDVLYSVINCDNSGAVNVVGAVANGSSKEEGVGQYVNASFAGVVAIAGSVAGTHVVESCINSGKLTLDVYMHADDSESQCAIGGVVGYATAKVNTCESSGEGLEVKNRVKASYVGGIVGRVGAMTTGCVNSAPIDYDMVIAEQNGNQSEYVNLGGIVGYSTTGATTVIQTSVNTGNITVKGGYNSGVASTIGGIAGTTTYGTINGSINGKKASVQGTYTIQTPAKVYFGGIVGEMKPSTSPKNMTSSITVFERRGSSIITNPGNGSRIGGICGVKRESNANDSQVNLVTSNFTVSCASGSDDIYAGLFFGEYSSYTGKTPAIGNSVMNASEFAPSSSGLTGSGLAVGYLSSGNIQLGGSTKFTVRPITYKGVVLEDGANTVEADWIGGKAEGTSVTLKNVVVAE